MCEEHFCIGKVKLVGFAAALKQSQKKIKISAVQECTLKKKKVCNLALKNTKNITFI